MPKLSEEEKIENALSKIGWKVAQDMYSNGTSYITLEKEGESLKLYLQLTEVFEEEET